LNKNLKLDFTNKAAVVTAALSLCTLHFSPALTSILTGLFFLMLLFQVQFKAIAATKVLFIALLSLLVWQLFASSLQGWSPSMMPKFLLRATWLLLSLFCMVAAAFSRRYLFLAIIGLGVFHTWVAGASVLHYLAHYRFLNQMVLESKPLPLFSRVYHIEFSMILAAIALLQCYLLTRISELPSKFYRLLLWTSTLLNVVFLHILSARTGILAFWIGLPWLFWPLFKTWNFRHKWFLLLLPVLLAILLPSVRNRLVNTLDDLMATSSHADISDKSFGRRWEAWKVAVSVIADNPATGVGINGVEEAMQEGFKQKNTYLHITDRVLPHNQYLDFGIQTGMPTVIIFVLCLLLLWRNAAANQNHILQSMVLFLAVAALFESYLERQAGVQIFVLAFFFAIFIEKKE
jgi:O-antigen ligase